MPPPKTWKLQPPSPIAPQLAQKTGITALQAQLLINRNISNSKQVDLFLNPRLANMADPMSLKGMGDAVDTILSAIENREKITIFGDYDADGLTATAVLVHFFSSLGITASSYIPSRLKEGYGINKEAIRRIADNGKGIIITVDCGISNTEEILLAKNLGIRVVVTDHHRVPAEFQAVCPVVNPHQPGCDFPFKELAGVGLAFYLAVSIRAALRERGWFNKRPVPDLKEYLDLVALGTVADKVPLLDQNRILVRGGMNALAKSRWAGMTALKEAAHVADTDITADSLGFRLAPRLNAPGRIGDPEVGLKMLVAREPDVARDLASRLNTANDQRQKLERQIFSQIEKIIEAEKPPKDSRTLVMAGEGWHKGVLGIVASRLVERYHRPSLVITIEGDIAVGSGRSIEGFDLHHALGRCGHLFERYGGHAYAAGFTLKTDNVEILRKKLEGFAKEALGTTDLTPTIDIDTGILLEEITPRMIREIGALSPFGEGNPEPVMLSRSLMVVSSRVVGEHHLRFKVRQGGKPFDAIGFGFAGWHSLKGKTIDMVYTPELNRWQGYERLQLRVIDLKIVLKP